MCSVGGAGRAELDCSVLEEDWQTGQSYTAHWHSLALVPLHHRRLAQIEAELSGKHWEARRILQRFLSGAISRNYPQPSRRSHQLTSDPSTVGMKVQQNTAHVQQEEHCVSTKPKSFLLETRERKTVVKMAKLPRFLG